jgi:N-acetylglutamate synthase-like GNAT family acetyltransferase
MNIDRATITDFNEVQSVLRECGLPTGNLVAEDMTTFLVVRSGRCIVGVAGLIIEGTFAVGHSLAVVPGFRGLGLGRQLATSLLDAASGLGIGVVYLFTCQAEFYFRAMGFSVVKHKEVPHPIMGILTALCSADTVGAGHILFFPLEQQQSRSMNRTDHLAGYGLLAV